MTTADEKTIRSQTVHEIAAFLDTVYQGKAADLIRAKARAGKFVGGTDA